MGNRRGLGMASETPGAPGLIAPATVVDQRSVNELGSTMYCDGSKFSRALLRSHACGSAS